MLEVMHNLMKINLAYYRQLAIVALALEFITSQVFLTIEQECAEHGVGVIRSKLIIVQTADPCANGDFQKINLYLQILCSISLCNGHT